MGQARRGQISRGRLVLHAISFRVPARAALGRIRSCSAREIKRDHEVEPRNWSTVPTLAKYV
jgi:hypothetical protein